ncbi:hypothetical protein CASFOL_018747 [Castilleja foliolosa]|uniref:Uncharacterized protein n=1 Tax=Castilleja foliolosa TaxID=1961234 RepID=A0ABD3D8J8_9LAMI
MFSPLAAQKLSSLMASKPQHLCRIADTTLLAAANAKKPRTMVTSADGSKPSTMKDAFSNYASYLNNLVQLFSCFLFIGDMFHE